MHKIVSICTLQVSNGNTNVFSGTDILSESGVASGYQEYENGFDFAGIHNNVDNRNWWA